ncbi:glycoside hydrolase, partial [Parabacteroides sp. OttesenSCG-928-K15]|nr:glycoside hydrolase [Parabacteroides sp. OttesenSCG-928-K15]
THISFDGRIVQKESYDQGKTWVNRKIIYESSAGNADARDPQFLALPNGEILCRFFVRTSEAESTVKIIKSADWGKTYTYIGDVPPAAKNQYTASRGNMLLVDNTIYTSIYNRWHDCWIMKSEDFGVSWDFVSWVSHSDAKLCSVNRGLNEASLCYQDGILYAIARSGFDQPRKLTLASSKDMGETWEWGELPVCGHSPSLTSYKDSYILTYRNINVAENEGENVQFDCVLFRKGALASKPFTVLKSKSTDIGYGDVYVFDDFFLLCCYTGNTIRCFRVLYDIFSQ